MEAIGIEIDMKQLVEGIESEKKGKKDSVYSSGFRIWKRFKVSSKCPNKF